MKIVNEMAETMQGVQADEGHYLAVKTDNGRFYCYGLYYGNGYVRIDEPYWHSPNSVNHPAGITALSDPMPPIMVIYGGAFIEELPLIP